MRWKENITLTLTLARDVTLLSAPGSADSGHYYSIVKERDRGKRWLMFNDDDVSEFDIEKNMEEHCFGT